MRYWSVVPPETSMRPRTSFHSERASSLTCSKLLSSTSFRLSLACSSEMNEEAANILAQLRVNYIPSLYIVSVLRRIIMIIDSSLLKKGICWKLKILDNIKTNDIQLFNYMLLIWLYHLLAVMMVSLFN